MPVKLTQHIVETVFAPVTSVRSTQRLSEVVQAATFPTFTPVYTVGTYGDACDTVTPDAAWTNRNISSFTGDGSAYSIPLDASGDVIHRAITDPAADFGIVAHIKGLTALGNMVGVFAVDGSGNGVGYSPYDDGNSYTWTLAAYVYSATRNSVSASGIRTADFWVHLQRTGTGWSGRWASGVDNLRPLSWSSWSSAYTDSRTIAKIGVGGMYWKANQANAKVELFVYGSTAPQFDGAGITGACVTQTLAEVITPYPSPSVRVTQRFSEVLMSAAEPTVPGVSSGGVKAFGYAG